MTTVSTRCSTNHLPHFHISVVALPRASELCTHTSLMPHINLLQCVITEQTQVLWRRFRPEITSLMETQKLMRSEEDKNQMSNRPPQGIQSVWFFNQIAVYSSIYSNTWHPLASAQRWHYGLYFFHKVQNNMLLLSESTRNKLRNLL